MDKKITLATLKSFIHRELKNDNLYIKKESDFNGMADCVMPVENSDFIKVKYPIDENDKYSLGIKGLWLVGQSRDSFRDWSNDEFMGFEVFNCCGSCIVAMKKQND
jgi:hypothetical protein